MKSTGSFEYTMSKNMFISQIVVAFNSTNKYTILYVQSIHNVIKYIIKIRAFHVNHSVLVQFILSRRHSLLIFELTFSRSSINNHYYNHTSFITSHAKKTDIYTSHWQCKNTKKKLRKI